MFGHIFIWNQKSLRKSVRGGSECGNSISCTNFCIALRSNYESILLGFRDMTAGRTDGRTTEESTLATDALLKLKLHLYDLLWICCTACCTTCRNVVDLLWICCRFATDLLWICCAACCTTCRNVVDLFWTCCGFVVDLLYGLLYDLLCKKSTTNRISKAWALGEQGITGQYSMWCCGNSVTYDVSVTYRYVDIAKCWRAAAWLTTNALHSWRHNSRKLSTLLKMLTANMKRLVRLICQA